MKRIFIIILLSLTLAIELQTNTSISIGTQHPSRGPFYGNIILSDGIFNYTPNIDFEGHDYMNISSEIVDIYVYKSCSSDIFNSTEIYATTEGNNFVVYAPYSREYNYRIDVCDQRSSCSTNKPLYHGTYPTSTFPGSLRYGSYNISNNYWSLDSKFCNKIEIASNFTTESLYNCGCTTVKYGNDSYIDHNGKLYINYYQGNLYIDRVIIPYIHRFYMVTSLVIVSGPEDFVKIYTLAIPREDGIRLYIRFISYKKDAYMKLLSYPESLKLTTSPRNVQSQEFVFDSESDWVDTCPSLVDRVCWYTFLSQTRPDKIDIEFSLGIKIDLRDTIISTNQAKLITDVYYDEKFSDRTKKPIKKGDYIYVEQKVEGINIRPMFKNLYICYPLSEDIIIQYNPDKGDLGCLQDFFVPRTHLFQLIDNYEIVKDRNWNIHIYKNTGNMLRAKIRINNPLGDIPYYVHIESGFDSNKREIPILMQSVSLASFTITIVYDYLWVIIASSITIVTGLLYSCLLVLATILIVLYLYRR